MVQGRCVENADFLKECYALRRKINALNGKANTGTEKALQINNMNENELVRLIAKTYVVVGAGTYCLFTFDLELELNIPEAIREKVQKPYQSEASMQFRLLGEAMDEVESM